MAAGILVALKSLLLPDLFLKAETTTYALFCLSLPPSPSQSLRVHPTCIVPLHLMSPSTHMDPPRVQAGM